MLFVLAHTFFALACMYWYIAICHFMQYGILLYLMANLKNGVLWPEDDFTEK
jgi:hypothetical protein